MITELAAELADYVHQVERIKEDAAELLNGLSEAQFQWRSEPSGWSIGECIVHLNVTGARYLPAIDTSIARARSEGRFSPGPYRHGFLGNWFMRSVEPPPKLRFKAPAAFRPVAGEPLAKAMPEFFRLQEQLLERIQGVSGLDLARAKTASPVIPLFKASLGQTFGIVLAHERRHLWQARQVRRAPDFPSS